MKLTSSTNTTLGAILLASEKTAFTYFSPSPNHCNKNDEKQAEKKKITTHYRDQGIEKRSFLSMITLDVMLDIEILMKFAPASVATALASIVLPVPGGPNRSMPLQGCTWNNYTKIVP